MTRTIVSSQHNPVFQKSGRGNTPSVNGMFLSSIFGISMFFAIAIAVGSMTPPASTTTTQNALTLSRF